MKAGLVATLNHPGGNVTGIYNFGLGYGAKRLGILAELVSAPAPIGVLINPSNPDAAAEAQEMQNTGTALGRRVIILNAGTEAAIDAAFAAIAEQHAGALYVGTGPLYADYGPHIVALAERYRIPTIYAFPDTAVAGGLMSYSVDFAQDWRNLGIYTARILKGESPANLLVMQSTAFKFIINLKTARALGLAIPSGLIASADEVIE